MRPHPWLVLPLVAACSASSRPATRTTEPLSPPPEVAPAPPVEPPAAEPEVDAEPDVPAGAAAARDAELARQAEVYVDAFLNMAPVWMPDGKRIVFISNRDGLPQVYVADARDPAATATRLTVMTERVGVDRPEVWGFAEPAQGRRGPVSLRHRRRRELVDLSRRDRWQRRSRAHAR
jgi:hypothetical protein